MRTRWGWSPIVFTLLLLAARDASAQDWIEIRSPHFTVVSNAGDRQARAVAWQFEQIRQVVTKLWPWARTDFDRPVIVFAVKDEASMRSLTPEYWERRNGIRPSSVLVSGPDAHYVTLRTDLDRDERDEQVNPYRSSYWSYIGIVLRASFEKPLPSWFTRGMAELFSNTIVRDNDVLVGPVLPQHIQALRERAGAAVPLDVQLSIDAGSPYLTDERQAPLFHASAWALLHYLALGNQSRNLPAFNAFVSAVIKGAAPRDALASAYGDVRQVDEAFRNYVREFSFVYYRLGIDTAVDRRAFAARPVAAADAAIARARVHATMRRPVEARAELAAARKLSADADAATMEVEGMLLEREGKRDEAITAYTRASDANRSGFYGEFRLAALSWPSSPAGFADRAALGRIEAHLRRAIDANAQFAPALSWLAATLTELDRAAEAVPLAQRAIALDAPSSSYRMTLARALWRLGQPDEARAAALAARALATNDAERASAQQAIDTFNRVLQPGTAPGAPRPAAAGTAAPRADLAQASVNCQQRRDAAACAQLSSVVTPACEQGSMNACGMVGWLLHQGLGMPKDAIRALTFYEKACDGGEYQACIGAAQLYGTGDGVKPDVPRARILLEKACKGGAAQACDIVKKIP